MKTREAILNEDEATFYIMINVDEGGRREVRDEEYRSRDSSSQHTLTRWLSGLVRMS